MKTVNMSSAECNAHNTNNAPAIEAGMLEAWTPSEQILKREAQDAAEAAQAAKFLHAATAVMQKIYNALPAAVQKFYTDPSTVAPCRYLKSVAGFYGEGVELEAYSTGTWRSSFAYFRIVLGTYGNKKITKLNETGLPSITDKQLTKVVINIVDAFNVRVRENNDALAKKQAAQRREEWLKDESNNKLAQLILNTTYVSYSDKVAVHTDGKVTLGWVTYTQAQWQQIAELKAKHNAEMAALTDSFKAPVAAAA